MKKVIVVSKTHLDLGFTDYGEAIKQKYIDTFIPNAIELAQKVNTEGKKRFVWTTGSWILKEALACEAQKDKLIKALKDGNIAPHAMPFTTHTELNDEDILDYGLSIVDELDKIRGKKTVAAKMTDVPGHTKGIVSLLAHRGVKLLHIGVNGASALADVPPCFLWKNGEDEVVVIYSGSYGGAFECEFIDEVLYFDHTVDNRGAPSPERVLEKLKEIQNEYPEHEVVAGTMDDFALAIWPYRNKLPVFDGEIGDSWIHGASTDPYKYAAMRELMTLKNQWLCNSTMKKESEEYKKFADALLCMGEHTCGMDSKMFFADYDNYLKKDFAAARKADKTPEGKSYAVFEKSWEEKRGYIDLALSALSDTHALQAKEQLKKLIPHSCRKIVSTDVAPLKCGEWRFEINQNGGIGFLAYADNEIIRKNEEPLVTYRSFGNGDYEYWLNHYSRDLEQTAEWALGDFARPGLEKFEGKYPVGFFAYSAEKVFCEKSKIIADLVCDKKLCDELGAPRLIRVVYTLCENGLNVDVSWFEKDASRLTEAIYLHFYPAVKNVMFKKLGCLVDPSKVVFNGGRNLHAVQGVKLGEYEIVNRHAATASVGKGKILEFDNKIEDVSTDGLSFVLYNNVWGTNFPLWYEDNAKFVFDIKKSGE